uniref:Amino acid transporter transmembrane domain-containing protein n=1 Tax=Amphimedon queenslandica TaxID=400682 RepID=A0A1X7VE06_AMPQE
MEGDTRWVINLGNSICGVSLLVLPYCFSQCGVLLGGLLLVSAALMTLWSTQLLVDCIYEKKSISCEGIAFALYGRYGKLLLEVSCALFMVGTCSAFFVIIADLAPVVFAWVASIPPDLPYLRILILFSLGVSVIFPLSLLRQLDSLSTLSTASIGFYAWLTIQLIVYALQKVGTTEISLWKSAGILHTVPIYAMSLSCHLQLVAIIKEIIGEIREGDIESRLRIKSIIARAILMVSVVYGSAALFGHIAFSGSGVKGDVLANFDDGLLAQLTRIGFVLSVVVSFPFMVNPCRSTVYSFLYGKTENYISNPKHFYITLAIITTSFLVAVFTPNIELVLALTGSVLGAIICFIFPSLSYLYAIKEKNENTHKALVVLLVGMVLLFGGTISALMPKASSSSLQGEHNVIEELGMKPVVPPAEDLIGKGKDAILPHDDPVVPVAPVGENLKETLKHEKDSLEDNVKNEKPFKPLRVLASEKNTPTERGLKNKSNEKLSPPEGQKPLPDPPAEAISDNKGGGEPAQTVQEPVKSAQEPVKNVQEPVKNVQEPAQNVQEPAKNPQDEIPNVQEPVKSVPDPVKDPAQESVQSEQDGGQNVKENKSGEDGLGQLPNGNLNKESLKKRSLSEEEEKQQEKETRPTKQNSKSRKNDTANIVEQKNNTLKDAGNT